MRNILLESDQLTCERVRENHMVRCDAEERLEGCMTMVEDFHEKMKYLQVKVKNNFVMYTTN